MIFPSLTELANQYGSDKGTVGPNRNWGGNNYTDIYEAYLARHRSAPIKLLEIGLGVTGDRWQTYIVQGRNTGGASLKMWHDYFENGMMYGLDINQCSYLDNERIKTFVVDQGSLDDLRAFVDITKDVEFDVIIDDGSHRPDHQQISVGFFFRRLKSGGIYFIEDLMANGLGDIARDRHSCSTVKNTRSLLKHFREHGAFPGPNALVDPDYLREHIDSVEFHAPAFSIELGLRPSLRHPIRKRLRYRPDSEKLCAILKK